MGARIVSVERSSANLFSDEETLKIIFLVSLFVFCGTLLRIAVRKPRLNTH
jgi:hypothetical protein